jgi:rhodanese-related sulfurtransferase
VARRLKRRGITRIHPLAGGVAAWMSRSFPVVELAPPAIPAVEGSSP